MTMEERIAAAVCGDMLKSVYATDNTLSNGEKHDSQRAWAIFDDPPSGGGTGASPGAGSSGSHPGAGGNGCQSSDGRGSNGGRGANGSIIVYYSVPKPVRGGMLRDKQGRTMLDKLGRKIIV